MTLNELFFKSFDFYSRNSFEGLGNIPHLVAASSVPALTNTFSQSQTFAAAPIDYWKKTVTKDSTREK